MFTPQPLLPAASLPHSQGWCKGMLAQLSRGHLCNPAHKNTPGPLTLEGWARAGTLRAGLAGRTIAGLGTGSSGTLLVRRRCRVRKVCT